jgi:hypothetical protein
MDSKTISRRSFFNWIVAASATPFVPHIGHSVQREWLTVAPASSKLYANVSQVTIVAGNIRVHFPKCRIEENEVMSAN